MNYITSFKNYLISTVDTYIILYEEKPKTIYLEYQWLNKVEGITNKKYFDVKFNTDLEFIFKKNIITTFPYLYNIPIKLHNTGIEPWYRQKDELVIDSFIYFGFIVFNDKNCFDIINCTNEPHKFYCY